MKKLFKTLPVLFATCFLGFNANAQWSLTGNDGISGTTNFIGSINDADVIFKRGGSQVMSLSTFSVGGTSYKPHYVNITNGLKIGTGSFSDGGAQLQIANDLEIGTKLTKASLAGRLKYNGSSTVAHDLSIYGGGTTTTNRVIKFYNEGGASFTGGVSVGGAPTAGSTHSDYKLAVKGKVVAQSIYVTADSWADYVFDKNYKLTPLSEVENFIKKEGHLRGIPTTEEVTKTGIDVAQMNAKLLEKVEELTLYMIEMKKELDTLKAIHDKSSK